MAGEALRTLDVAASFTPPPEGTDLASGPVFQEAVFAPSTDEMTQLVIDGEGDGTPRTGTPRRAAQNTHNWDGLLKDLPMLAFFKVRHRRQRRRSLSMHIVQGTPPSPVDVAVVPTVCVSQRRNDAASTCLDVLAADCGGSGEMWGV